jgi:hypothetical protein
MTQELAFRTRQWAVEFASLFTYMFNTPRSECAQTGFDAINDVTYFAPTHFAPIMALRINPWTTCKASSSRIISKKPIALQKSTTFLLQLVDTC